jgi:chorismate mutase/prephenate dehydratase
MKIEDLRQEIDAVDSQILDLISQRANLAKQVGLVKEKNHEQVDYYRSDREAQIIRSLLDKNKSTLPDKAISNIFKDIISACRSLEKQLNIAFLGPNGTFSHEALLQHFGKNNNIVASQTIEEVFRQVSAKLVDFGVVPIENSTEGSVSNTLDCLLENDIAICAEIELPIHHYLLTSPENIKNKGKITRIYSHNQSLAQCNNYLSNHYPNADRVATNSTAAAASAIAYEWNSAAIASKTSSELYNLEVVAEKIEDNPNNTTRFLVIGHYKTIPTGKDKTSILVTMHNKPGALMELLTPFKNASIDLTRLETRPSKHDKWSYVFFVDFEGHIDDEKSRQALEALKQMSIELKILGSYPKAF